MHGNNPHAGLPGSVVPAGQPPGLNLDDLSDSDRASLKSFATTLASETQEYLPDEYWVDTTFQTVQGMVMLGVTIGCPSGGMVQCEIRPTTATESSADSNGPVDSDGNTMGEEITEVSQQLAATAAFQSMMMTDSDEMIPFGA